MNYSVTSGISPFFCSYKVIF